MRKHFLTLCLGLFLPIFTWAQVTVSGTVTDKADGSPLPGANITIEGTNMGNSSKLDGTYAIRNVRPGSYVLKASFIGYKEQKKEITVGRSAVTVDFALEEAFLETQALEVTADRARERETPVAFSDVPKVVLEQQLASRDIPLILNTTPSIYATNAGGGSGDSRINMRGFDQRNIAVMINGVPVNDMENGWVYWSNWDGLGDVTSNIQVQRGLGASNLAVPSFGGTINILTDAANLERRATLKQEIGSDAFLKTTLAASTGMVNNKWAFSTALVRKTGDGYVRQLYTDAYAYFATFAYNFSSKNRVDLFLVGAPQQHGQRSTLQLIGNWDSTYARKLGITYRANDLASTTGYVEGDLNLGLDYNPNWGTIAPTGDANADLQTYLNGKSSDPRSTSILWERENYYHKPQANLNWYFRPNDQLFITNVFYGSKGIGGGSGTAGTFPSIITNPADPNFYQQNWQARYLANTTSFNNTYSTTENVSTSILRNSVNQHIWYGWLGKVEYQINKNINVAMGLDARHYTGQHWREVRNLIGGDYYLDTADFNQTSPVKRLGDKIQYWNDGIVDWLGGYLQAEATYGSLTAAISSSLSQTNYDRLDYFRPKYNSEYEHAYIDADGDNVHDATEVSERQKFPGLSLKGGINYNFTPQFNVFVNAGTTDRAPVFDAVYRNNNTIIRKSDGSRLDTEKFQAVELGMGYKTNSFKANLNAYFADWTNRTIRSTQTIPGSSIRYTYLMSGINQRHKGVELDGSYKPLQQVELNFGLSMGNWLMRGVGQARGVREDQPNATEDTADINVNGLRVPDQPQNSGSLGITYRPIRGAYISLSGTHFRDMYAFFDPTSRAIKPNVTLDTAQAWKVPNYTLLDLHAGYHLPFKIQGIQRIQLSTSVLNLLNEMYISDATDGFRRRTINGVANSIDPLSHTATLAQVYFGALRRFNFSVKIEI